MNVINKYVPLYSAKGYNEEMKKWIYGWHWTQTPYQCFETDEKIRHYIRHQNNMDWGLTEQKDYEVVPESVCYYIGIKDKNGVPLYTKDIVKIGEQEELTGFISYSVRYCAYGVFTEKGIVMISDRIEIEKIGEKKDGEYISR